MEGFAAKVERKELDDHGCSRVVDMGEKATAATIAAAAQLEDPSIEMAPGVRLARECLCLLDEDPALSANDLVRDVVRRHEGTDVSWIIHIARIAVQAAGARHGA